MMRSTLPSSSSHQTHHAASHTGQRTGPSRGAEPLPQAIGAGKSPAAILSMPRVVAQRRQLQAAFGHAIQRQAMPEDEPLQGKFATAQRQGALEEEEPLQGRFAPLQRQGPEEEELPQGKFARPYSAVQTKPDPAPNRTGMPDRLKAGVESLSGMDMSDVRVHANSDRPAQMSALAYAQGNDIHLAPGQDRHLPHEAWHLVQQRQGRVQPTMQMQGTAINDDAALENEADAMGEKALQVKVDGDPLFGSK